MKSVSALLGSRRRYLGLIRNYATVQYKGSKRETILSDLTRNVGAYTGGHKPVAVNVVTPSASEIKAAKLPTPAMRMRIVPAFPALWNN